MSQKVQTENRRLNIRNGAISFYIGMLTLELYWPQIFYRGYRPTYGFAMKTCIIFIPAKDWAWDYSLAIMLLGFGIGGAWNHVDNPAHIIRSTT